MVYLIIFVLYIQILINIVGVYEARNKTTGEVYYIFSFFFVLLMS